MGIEHQCPCESTIQAVRQEYVIRKVSSGVPVLFLWLLAEAGAGAGVGGVQGSRGLRMWRFGLASGLLGFEA